MPLLLPTVGVGAVLAAASACSATKHEILSFFFDGVPAETSAPTTNPEALRDIAPAQPSDMGPPMVQHRPYSEGKCDRCHSSRFGKPDQLGAIFQGVPMLLAPIEELCFKCHSIEQKRYLHAPAISGQCTFCHEPHRTPNRRMLLAPTTRELCVRCHSGSTFLTEHAHATHRDRECIECHDPHAADFEFNLLPGARDGAPEPRLPTVSLPTKW